MKYFFIFGFLIIALGLVSASPVFALTVSPVKLEVSGNPGETITGQMELFNEQSEAKTVYSSFANFEASGETGAPHFIDSKEGLATWIETGAEVVLEKNEFKKVPFSITIPKNAEPGGHFAAIFWGTQPPSQEGGGQIAVGGKVGILVLLKVSGDIKEGGGLVDFLVKGKQKFFTALPVTFEYRVSNTGQDRMVPSGEIKIKNMLVIPSATVGANPKKSSVLPNSTRKIEVLWGQDSGPEKKLGFFGMAWQELKHFHVGWYRASLNLALANNKTEHASFSFFILPWQLLLIMMVILLILGISGFFGIKKYNTWIISKVMSQQKGSTTMFEGPEKSSVSVARKKTKKSKNE